MRFGNLEVTTDIGGRWGWARIGPAAGSARCPACVKSFAHAKMLRASRQPVRPQAETMRILYIDIDTLRADHLGCYGYHRATSPNIDRVAAEGVRFARCYASDVPCLPSRSALISGRFGIHNGVVGHGGTAADPFADADERTFSSQLGRTSFAALLRKLGLRTATLSSFAERHSAFHWHAGFQETATVGKRGLENADEVFALADDWLGRNGRADGWFLHVQLWDPHTPYRAPASFGDPFAGAPLPAWLTEDVRAAHMRGVGPHSAQETVGFSDDYPWGDFPRQPRRADSMQAVRRMFDGYDAGVLYADVYVGRLLERLAQLGVLDDTAILISADHGETLGELNIYCDHHTADEHVARVPMILRWPGLAPRVDQGLHYQIDVAASVIELLGGTLPDVWDGRGFAAALRAGRDAGRDALVLTQGAWTCQRAVRFADWLCIFTYHDGYHGFPREMLFDVARDPHEQHDLAAQRPAVVAEARERLRAWHAAMMATSRRGVDPLDTVLAEGGPYHVRGQLPAYLERLRATGRAQWAEHLARAHPEAARPLE
jgi:arylsulfatase A-like enzyme